MGIAAADPAARRQEIIASIRARIGPLQAAEGFGIDEKVMERVRKLEGVRTVSATANESKQVMRVQVCDAGELLTPVTKALDCKVIDVRVKEPTLEDAYLWLVEGHAS